MRILVLDDDLTRHHTFARNLRGHEVVHAQTYDSALAALLDAPRFDLVYLDHDLNDFGQLSIGPSDSMYGGVREMDGRDVASFIARSLPQHKRPKRFIVHSWNEEGAAMMIMILRRAGFPCDKEEFHPNIGELAER